MAGAIVLLQQAAPLEIQTRAELVEGLRHAARFVERNFHQHDTAVPSLTSMLLTNGMLGYSTGMRWLFGSKATR